MALKTRAVSIPGTYQLSKVVGVSLGAFLMLAITIGPCLAIGLWQIAIFAAVLGGGLGLLVTSWSPLKGESLARWLLLWSAKRMGLVKRGGRYLRVYVGMTAVKRAPFGLAQMVKSYEEVPDAEGLQSILPSPLPSLLSFPSSVQPFPASSAPSDLPPFPPPPVLEPTVTSVRR